VERNFSEVYDKAGRKLFNAYRKAMTTLPAARQEPALPSVDELWQSSTVRDLVNLTEQFGPDTVAGWVKYMQGKGGGM